MCCHIRAEFECAKGGIIVMVDVERWMHDLAERC